MGVGFTMHEIITGEDHSPMKCAHGDRKMSMVQDLEEWIPCRKLDTYVSTFRSFLNDWVARRSRKAHMKAYLNAARRFNWPDMPTPPDNKVPYKAGYRADGIPYIATGYRKRRSALEIGQYCFR